MTSELAQYLPDGLSKPGREIADQLLRGLDDITRKTARLGALLVEMSDEDRAIFMAGFPSQYREIWKNLHRVGLGEMHPRLVTASGRAAQALRKLPFAEQEQYLVELIPVVIGDGPRAVKHFDIENLPADLMSQVFAQGGSIARVRSVADQRTWRAQNAAKKDAAEAKRETTEINRPGKWAVRHGKVFIAVKWVQSGLTREMIENMLKDLKI